MKLMGIFNRVKRAYTLAEVIIVLVVISVVVGVTMRVAKARLDNITTYTYYAAYNVLNDITGQMLADFNPSRTEYTQISFNNNFFMNLFALPAYSAPDATDPADPAADVCSQPSGGCTPGLVWSGQPTCSCVAEPTTIPRKGTNFCQMFVLLANTKVGTSCNGSAVAANNTDFSSLTADFTLRNGMKVYNASQNPTLINALSLVNHTGAQVAKDDGTVIYMDEYGYTLYVDIDGGKSGDSILWEDIFPFYVTLSGKVIPVFKSDDISSFGGGSRYYLQTSIQVDSTNNEGATQYWLEGAKSISFREAACRSGYIDASAAYCKTAPAIAKSSICSRENTVCSIKKVCPIKPF